MVTSLLGNTCEGKRNVMKVKLTRTEEEILKWTDKPEYQSSKIISEELATVCLKQSEILWDKPTIVYWIWLSSFCSSFTTKSWRKLWLQSALFRQGLLRVWNALKRLLCRTTVEKVISWTVRFFVFPTSAPLYNRNNARVTLKFEDEMGSQPIAEFFGLKPMLYSIKLTEGKYKSFSPPFIHHIRPDIQQKTSTR